MARLVSVTIPAAITIINGKKIAKVVLTLGSMLFVVKYQSLQNTHVQRFQNISTKMYQLGRYTKVYTAPRKLGLR